MMKMTNIIFIIALVTGIAQMFRQHFEGAYAKQMQHISMKEEGFIKVFHSLRDSCSLIFLIGVGDHFRNDVTYFTYFNQFLQIIIFDILFVSS